MNTFKNTYFLVITLSISILSCKEKPSANSENSDEQVKINTMATEKSEISFANAEIGKIFIAYLNLRDALIESDAEMAKEATADLRSLEGADFNKISEVATLISASDDLESQRLLFSELTTLIEPLIKDHLAGGKVYKQYCPMAFNNDGASWLSAQSAIRNPYFGSKMLKCGEITETFTE